jgi:hypothetical protein
MCMTPNYILKINELYTKFKRPLKLGAMLRHTGGHMGEGQAYTYLIPSNYIEMIH